MATPYKLDRIRVQTARMIEIYALLRRELDRGGRIGLSPHDRVRLQHAVDTIAANMGQLLSELTATPEHPAAAAPAAAAPPSAAGVGGLAAEVRGLGRLDGAEARKLEAILDAVLKWQSAAGPNAEGE